MWGGTLGRAGAVVAVLVVATLPLAGCAALMPGSGSGAFGGGAATAEATNVSAYTTETDALTAARSHFKNNDFGYSAALYKRAADLAPKDPEAYAGLGASYDRLGRFDLSDRVYAALYQLSGDSVQYYNNLGYSYMLRGNLSLALTNFRKAKALAPDNAVVANNLQIIATAAHSA